ncbi:MAG: hypothetical protein Q8Q60_03515 [Candidatus Chromulinivorax sp.]|nr:hypothetical protein [Candidatus Chromulinivorax sp.]
MHKKTMLLCTLFILCGNFQTIQACWNDITFYEKKTNPNNHSEDITTYFCCCCNLTQISPKRPTLRQSLINNAGQSAANSHSLESLTKRIDMLETLVQQIAQQQGTSTIATNIQIVDRN